MAVEFCGPEYIWFLPLGETWSRKF